MPARVEVSSNVSEAVAWTGLNWQMDDNSALMFVCTRLCHKDYEIVTKIRAWFGFHPNQALIFNSNGQTGTAVV